jgi:Cu2+-exporting ATPase
VRSGLLIRDGAAFERAHNLDTVLFDKTGTLTEGRFAVSAVRALADMNEAEILARPPAQTINRNIRSWL